MKFTNPFDSGHSLIFEIQMDHENLTSEMTKAVILGAAVDVGMLTIDGWSLSRGWNGRCPSLSSLYITSDAQLYTENYPCPSF